MTDPTGQTTAMVQRRISAGLRPLRKNELRRLELLAKGPRACTDSCGISRARLLRGLIEPTGQVNRPWRRVQYRITVAGRKVIDAALAPSTGQGERP